MPAYKTPIPTLYNGIQFRSKLEAQWAAFFDLVGWKYTYEPYEINGRLPDFIIYCQSPAHRMKQCIVEVKPKVFSTEKWFVETIKAYKDYPANILFLNEDPFYDHQGYCALGAGYYHGDPDYAVDTYSMKCDDDFGSIYGMWDALVFGKVDRTNFISSDEPNSYKLKTKFRDAGNKVQFDSYSKN